MMLKRLKCFIKRISNSIDSQSSKIDMIKNDFEDIKEKFVAIEESSNIINKIENQILDLQFKLDNLSTKFVCTNLEYLNLDYSILKQKILIAGFYGAPNLGDELMLKAVFDKLLTFDPDLDITVMMSENFNFDITKYPKCKIIHYPNSIIDINTLSNYYDALIVAGGALLDDIDYNINISPYSLSTTVINLAYRMITCKKKVILYGLSTSSELNNLEFIEKLKFIVCNSNYFSLRDANSLNILKKYGIDIDKVNIVHDLVFSLDYFKYKGVTNNNTFKTIGLIYICNEDTFKILSNLTKAIINYFKSNNVKYKIVLIPFYEYLNNDTFYYKKLIDYLKDNNVELLNYSRDIFDIISMLDICVSMRYHGTLISNILGVPTLNLLFDNHRHYNNKLNYLYNNYKFKNFQVRYSNININDFIDVFDILCKENKRKILDKKIYIESNKQLEDVIKMYIIEEEK